MWRTRRTGGAVTCLHWKVWVVALAMQVVHVQACEADQSESALFPSAPLPSLQPLPHPLLFPIISSPVSSPLHTFVVLVFFRL